jgi:hypothetical protein
MTDIKAAGVTEARQEPRHHSVQERITGLETQVKMLEDQVRRLMDTLASAERYEDFRTDLHGSPRA